MSNSEVRTMTVPVMERNIINYVCEALISSESQINVIDKTYDLENGGDFGTAVKIIASNVKGIFTTQDDHLYILSIISAVENICEDVERDHRICHFLSRFFHYVGKSVEDLNLNRKILNQNNKPLVKDIIEIEDNSDSIDVDSSTIHPNDLNEVYAFTSVWIDILKLTLNRLCDSKYLCDDTYASSIFNGFFSCLTYAINIEPNRCLNIVDLTHTIEILASSGNINDVKDFNKHNFMFNTDGLPNPALQLLATTFRAIVEAMKASHV